MRTFQSMGLEKTKFIGVDVHVLKSEDARISQLCNYSQTTIYSAPEDFHDWAKEKPELQSNVHYDAKLWQFIQKQHPIVREADFSRHGVGTPAHEGHVADSMVGRAERSVGDKGCVIRQNPRYRVNFRGFQSLV